ncbi:adenosine trna methylthiotransferase [Diplogelasinospora grovesii]|uniref:Adenosine trna methylthiotransferase n=1 Tax=Diplogelasinospora grovesii TaxID=303347 RepID=A0AAN6NCU6_9PEZI|nr:adenosine trna methylthiotransferase [Diplogelasinospora grovesii]
MSHVTLQSTDDTSRWVAHKAPGFDSAWALAEALRKQKIPPASEKLETRKRKFSSYINGFLSSQKDQEAHTAFRNASSWEDVRREAEKAIDNYANQGKSWRNPFRRAQRLVGGAASRLEFLTVLIPDGDYLGVLCGGLKLAYNAANRNKQLRELILGSLESLGTEIDYTKLLIHEYAWDENLRQKTEDLYIAILDAVEAIMKWIERRKGVRGILEAGKAIAQQEEYGKKLETDVKSNIKDKVEAFDRAVRTCLSIQVGGIAANVVTLGTTVDIVDGKIDDAIGEFRRNVAATQTVEDLLRSMADAMRHFMQEERDRQAQLALNQERLCQTLQAQGHLLSAGPPLFLPRPIVTIPQLLQALNLAQPGPATDVSDQIAEKIGAERDLMFYFRSRFGSREQSRISSVLRDPRFVDWFKGPASGTLVVNGMDIDALHNDVLSPWGYLCAALAKSVNDIPQVYPIAFFCRSHVDPADRINGAAGLMRSLIAQLVLQHPNTEALQVSLAFADLHAVQNNNIAALCGLFDLILKSLGQGVVICMIDGVDFFESEFHLQNIDVAMRYLNSVVQAIAASTSGFMFKLLVSSTTASENTRSWFPNRVDLAGSGDLMLGGPGLEGLGPPMAIGLPEMIRQDIIASSPFLR